MNVILSCTGICKNFGALQVLKNVDVSVARGESLGIVGPNGAGKTTLFSVIAGSHMPTAGNVVFDGKNISGLDPSMRCRAGIGRTYQVPRPFSGMTVFENVLVAAEYGSSFASGEFEVVAARATEKAGLIGRANQPAGALGLLDRKRLELARALATQPSVLLFDEIGGGLTEAELHILVELISELKSDGMTIIWIEHILHALLKVIDRLVCMSEGQVIAEGEPEAVMADESVMNAYLGGSELNA